MRIEEKKISEIKENENNPRYHSAKQIEQICSSIKEFGFVNPILIDQENSIIAGHGRYKAAKKLKLKLIPTITLKDLTQDQIKALIIADNKIANNSSWNEDLLWEQIKELTDTDFDISILGFDEEQIIPFVADEAVVHDILEEWNDMPEFSQADLTSERTLLVHFANQEDVEKFFQLINQSFTDKTKYIWYPEQENMDTEAKRYES